MVDSRPGAGSWTRQDAVVAITISQGPKLSDVPNVVGMQLDQAKAAIIENDLAINPNIERHNSIEPLDKVLSQDPPPKQVKSGDLVTLVVSDGPAILPIPPLNGKSGDAAEKELSDLGFTPVRQSVFNGAADRDGGRADAHRRANPTRRAHRSRFRSARVRSRSRCLM